MYKQQSNLIKGYQQQIKKLKKENRSLEQQINQRVRNYLIQHRSFAEQKKATNKTLSNLQQNILLKETSISTFPQQQLQSPNFSQHFAKYSQIKVKAQSAHQNNKTSNRIQRLLSIKICPTIQNQNVIKDFESQYIPTQEDSFNMDNQNTYRGTLNKSKEKDLELERLTKKVQQLLQKLQKSEQKNNALKEQFQKKLQASQSQSKRSISSMKILIDQLEQPLKEKLQKGQDKEIKAILQQQNAQLKQQMMRLKYYYETQNSQLKALLKKQNKKLQKEYFLKQQFLKTYARIKAQNEELQEALKQKAKMQSYLTFEPIIETQMQQRPSSTISSSSIEQKTAFIQSIKGSIEGILQAFENSLSEKAQYNTLCFIQIFERLKELYEGTWNTNFVMSIDLRKNKQQRKEQAENVLNKLHKKYQQIIDKLIKQNQSQKKKAQCDFDSMLCKMIKIRAKEHEKIENTLSNSFSKNRQNNKFMQKISQIVHCSPQKLQKQQVKQSKQSKKHKQYFLKEKVRYQPCLSMDSSIQNSQKQIQLAKNVQLEKKIQQLETKIIQMKKYQEQVIFLRIKLEKTEKEFEIFMKRIAISKKYNQARLLIQQHQKQMSFHEKSFIKVFGKRIYNLVQLIPQSQQEQVSFEPESNQQIMPLLNMIESFFNRYQKLEQQKRKQKQLLEYNFFNLLIKLINLYDIKQEQIFQQFKQSHQIVQLKNLLHQYYCKRKAGFKINLQSQQILK